MRAPLASAEQATAPNAGIALRFQSEYPWPGVGELCRSLMLRSVKALFTSIVLDGILAVVGVLAGCGNPPQVLPSPKRGPTISEINDQRILEDQSTTVAFTVGDPDTPLTQLQLSALSSDQSLLPTNNIVFEGIGAKRKAVI